MSIDGNLTKNNSQMQDLYGSLWIYVYVYLIMYIYIYTYISHLHVNIYIYTYHSYYIFVDENGSQGESATRSPTAEARDSSERKENGIR